MSYLSDATLPYKTGNDPTTESAREVNKVATGGECSIKYRGKCSTKYRGGSALQSTSL